MLFPNSNKNLKDAVSKATAEALATKATSRATSRSISRTTAVIANKVATKKPSSKTKFIKIGISFSDYKSAVDVTSDDFNPATTIFCMKNKDQVHNSGPIITKILMDKY